MMLHSLVLAYFTLAPPIYAQFGIIHTQYGTSPPVYPSPKINGAVGWDEALEKAKAFVAQLTLGEKANLITGSSGPCVGNIAPIERLNFSGLCLQDGPLAIRQAVLASVFPAGITAAASWDRELVRERAVQMGEEFKTKGSQISLQPVVGPLGRTPFGGRNWEGFSPDAYLSGALVEETVLGTQSAGVQACTKHYIGNEQEIQRNPNRDGHEALSSNIDDKTLHETYLWPFANAVKAGTTSIMCSYQRANGSYGCQNSKLLNGLLKTELAFQGYVMSDWGATHSGVASIEAGLDMNMPGGGSSSLWGSNIPTAVNNGTLDVLRVDDMILRIMTPYYFLGQDAGFPPVDRSSGALSRGIWDHNYMLGPIVDARAEHSKLIRELGAAGIVLLKKTNNTLPFKEPKNIGVFGNDAADFTEGQLSGGDYDIGTLAAGGGSGTGRFTYVISPLDAIKARAQPYGGLVQYITSNTEITGGGLNRLAPIPLDVCIVFLKTWASEGDDRRTLVADWSSTAVVEAVAARCANTVVVLHGTAPNILPWKDNVNVTAILAAHFPGQETGNSLVDVLWGEVNPSGKLPYTIANSEGDYPHRLVNSTEFRESANPSIWQDDFTDGNLIDYKGFDAANKSVAFEFGFGLSYTTFELSGLSIKPLVSNASRVPSSSAKVVPGGNEELWKTVATVSATVKNTGDVDGAAVPQLYISFPPEAGNGTPVRSLRGFDKIPLAAGAASTVQFPLLRRDVSFWDVIAQNWRLPSSPIAINVGFSSRDLKLKGELAV